MLKTEIISFKALVGTNSSLSNSVFESLGNMNYLIGTLFALLAILAFAFIKKAQANSEKYKKRQLEVYNKNRPKQKPVTNYKHTKLYLPFWEKVKLSAPIMFGLTFSVIAITFFVGASLSTF